MRLFVSVDLPDRLAKPVSQLQTELVDAADADTDDTSARLTLTDPTQAHFTLKFLGNVEAERLPTLESELTAALEDAAIDPFRVTLGGLGAFPSFESARVIWLGVLEGADGLRRLHESVEDRLTAIGFDGERHEFTPHVTLGRLDPAGGSERVRSLVREYGGEDEGEGEGEGENKKAVGEMTVSEIRLTESTLTDSGPSYSTLERFPLR